MTKRDGRTPEQEREEDVALARGLEVTLGCVRAWRRKGAPLYARLAIAALEAGLAPTKRYLRGAAPGSSKPKPIRRLRPIPRLPLSPTP